MKPIRKSSRVTVSVLVMSALVMLALWVVNEGDGERSNPTASEIHDQEEIANKVSTRAGASSVPQTDTEKVSRKDPKLRRERDMDLTRHMEAQLNAHGWAVEKIDLFGRQVTGLKSLLNRFYDTYGNYPEGSTLEVVNALAGENLQGIKFIKDPKFIDGLTVDQFGTVLSIQLGNKKYEIEIRSAGPDRQFSTNDDQAINWYADVCQ